MYCIFFLFYQICVFFVTKNMAKAVIKFIMEISCIFLCELSKSDPESLSFYPCDLISVSLYEEAYVYYWQMNQGWSLTAFALCMV
jgi:hypothetical protein